MNEIKVLSQVIETLIGHIRVTLDADENRLFITNKGICWIRGNEVSFGGMVYQNATSPDHLLVFVYDTNGDQILQHDDDLREYIWLILELHGLIGDRGDE